MFQQPFEKAQFSLPSLPSIGTSTTAHETVCILDGALFGYREALHYNSWGLALFCIRGRAFFIRVHHYHLFLVKLVPLNHCIALAHGWTNGWEYFPPLYRRQSWGSYVDGLGSVVFVSYRLVRTFGFAGPAAYVGGSLGTDARLEVGN
jgi:hypothetical protein